MKWFGLFVAVVIAVVLLAGCSNTSRSSGSPGDSGWAGTWSGSWSSAVFEVDGELLATSQVSGDEVTGTMQKMGSGCFENATFTGTISGAIAELDVVQGASEGDFLAILRAFGSSISGSYSVLAGPCGGDSGTFSLSRQ